MNVRYSNNPDENDADYTVPDNTEAVWQPELSADVFMSALNKRQQNYLNQQKNVTQKPLQS